MKNLVVVCHILLSLSLYFTCVVFTVFFCDDDGFSFTSLLMSMMSDSSVFSSFTIIIFYF